MTGRTYPLIALCAAIAALLFLAATATAEAPPPRSQTPPGTAQPEGSSAAYAARGIRGGSEVEFFGEIRFGSAQDLGQALARNPDARVLHLNSPGGSIGEAREMAQLVRDRAMTTTIDRACMSACTLVFLAGKERVLVTGAELGFHRTTALDMNAAETDAIQEPDRRYMLSIGIPAAFVDRVYSTPSSTIWIPTAVELRVAHAVTEVSDRYRLSVAKVVPAGNDDFDQMNRIIAALKEVDPARYRQLHEHLFQQMQAGANEAQISAIVDSELTKLFTRFISHASDGVVVEYVRIFRGMLVALRTLSPDACYFTLYPEHAPAGFGSRQMLSAAESKQVSNIVLKAALDGAVRNAPLPSDDQVAEANDALARLMIARYPADLKVLEQASKPDADHDSACGAEVDMFAVVLMLPEHQQGVLLRHLFADESGDATAVAALSPAWPSRLHPDK